MSRVPIVGLRDRVHFWAHSALEQEKIMSKATVKPTQVSPVREDITLETRSNILLFPGQDFDWLMRDIVSTPYATVIPS